MKSRLSFFILFILLLVTTFPTFAESEPNDTFATADPIGIGLSNAEVGAFVAENDLDYYYFEAVAGRTYVIETYNIQGTGQGQSATGLWLYNSSQSLLTHDQYGSYGTGNANARIIYTFITSGTYYILVKERDSYNWTGDYSLRILAKYNELGAEWDVTNDYEPNDTKEVSNEIEVGLNNGQTHQLFNHTNYVTNDSDYDFYHFEAVEGRTYVIETYNIQGTGTGQSATGLWLYNGSGTLLANDEYGSYGTGNANARIVYTFLTSGTYFVLVKDRSSYSWTGTYAVRILPKYDEPGADWGNDDEPNDVRELSNEIEVGLTHGQTHQLFDHTNYVTNDSDYDWYRFSAVAGRTYVIETYDIQGTGIGQSATGLWLYNNSGTQLTDDQYGSFGTGNANARIVYTFSTSGIYYILVKDRSSYAWLGSYSLRVLPMYNEPGAMWDPTDDYEPNDVLPLANEIGVGVENGQTHQLFNHTTYVTNNSDHDFYHFHAQAGVQYIIQTYSIQASGRATGLWLFSGTGVELANDQYGDAQTGQAQIEFTFVTTGEYFLLVKDASNVNWIGTYSVRVCEGSCLQKVYLPVVVR